MKFVALAALALALGYAAFRQAGVGVQDWCICLIAVGVTSVVYFLVAHRREVPRFDRFAAIMLAVFVSIAALQLAPLPVGLVRVLSPARVEFLDAVTHSTGGPPGFVTLSAVPYAT